ncbi:MAG: hypothetical protein IPJ94_03735 [Chloroflexi bacterium]|nr:hypothetical protein [Chloroflexota bacterium]
MSDTNQFTDAQLAAKAETIGRLLPVIFQRTLAPDGRDALSALLSVMAHLTLGVETTLTAIDSFFEPDRARLDFLVFLAYWVDLEALLAPDQPPGLVWQQQADWPALVRQNFPTGLDRLRALVAEAIPLAQQRSTDEGLIRFLEVATGLTGFEVLEREDTPFHICVIYPETAVPHLPFIRRIIEFQKPAYLTHCLALAGQDHENCGFSGA